MKAIKNITIFILTFFSGIISAQANIPANQWVFIESKVSRLHLDVKMGSLAAKTLVWMFSPNGTAAQQWKFENAGGGYYYIKSRRSGLYLDVQGGSKQPKAMIWQFPLNRSDAQKWKPIPAGNGHYYLQAKVSGLYLNVQGGRKETKTPVWQYALNRSDAQKWKLKVVAGNTSDNANQQLAFEDIPVWKMTLSFKTSHRDNAGTDDEIYLYFGEHQDGYRNFFLDKGGDDRERGDIDTYEIMDPRIKTIRDIKKMKIRKYGEDGWNFNEVKLYVNGALIFEKYYREGQWIDNYSKKHPWDLTISGSELRQNPNWRYTTKNQGIKTAPKYLRLSSVEKMMESYFGHQMNANGKRRRWEFGKKSGRAYVEGRTYQANKLLFDLDLVRYPTDIYDVTKKLGIEIEMDVDFWLTFDWNGSLMDIDFYFQTLYGNMGDHARHRRDTQANYIKGFAKILKHRINTIVKMGKYQDVKISKDGNIIFN